MPKLTAQQPPPPDYYAGNLRLMLEHVQAFHGDLLTAEEAGFVAVLLGLPSDPQRLYARLLSRKGPWIRIDRLRYREIGCLSRAIGALEKAGLVQVNEPAPADALLRLLTQAERRALFPAIPAAGRDPWIAECVTRHDDRWIRRRLTAHHPWISLTGRSPIGLCQLLFFGDERQDLSTFVLQDLGLFTFERYRLSRSERMFADRAELERTRLLARLNGLSHRLAELPGLAGWLADVLWLETRTRHEQRRKDRILNRLGQWFERAGELDAALGCYARSRSHPGRERRARILARLGDEAGSQALVRRIAASPRSAEEVDFARRFASRPRRGGFTSTEVPLAATPEVSIETHAAGLLGASGGAVFHLENHFPLGLAGLAFWELIFAEQPGAFVNPFQSAPLDLFWPDFAASRAQGIAARVAELSKPGAMAATLRSTHRAKHGVANRLVSWRHFSARVLETALANIPEEALLALARHVIRWPYRTRTGFPDLVVIYGPGSYEFVEVKGPTDQLQPAQRVWLKALEDLSQPARVLKFKAC